uniref:Uncharacterized protein n=1 Tax=viral metagenome TaxID=1070528 RepID=A0A6M3JGU3_9ZZZZ
MLNNIVIWLFIILIVFSTLMTGILALICMHVLQSVIKLYSEYEKRRRKENVE